MTLGGPNRCSAGLALIVFACLALAGCGESGWHRVDPGFTDENAPRAVRWSNTTALLYSIWGSDGSQLWAVGEGGTILHTADGGKTWETQRSGTLQPLNAIFGIGTELWAVGDNGTIVHTADGGKTWAQQSSRTNQPLRSVFGIGRELWAVGSIGSVPTILHTADGGKTWEEQSSSPPYYGLNSVFASDKGLWAVGYNGTILHTADGGKNWDKQYSERTNHLYSVFRSGTELWAVGYSGTILHTADGGKTWETQRSGTLQPLNAIFGVGNELWAVGEDGTIVHTADGGKTWAQQSSRTNQPLRSVFGIGRELWAVGDYHTILHTADGGRSWEVQSGGTSRHSDFESVFGTGKEFWAVGSGGTILHTADYGKTWEEQSSTTNNQLKSVFGSGGELWAVGDYDTILHTPDGGKNWDSRTTGTNGFFSSVFGVGRDLWMIGNLGTILHSADGGQTWEEQSSGTTDALWSVFGSGKELWAVGEGGTILHTADGGKTWETQRSGTLQPLNAIFGIGTELWAVGDNGTIVHTADGGKTWVQQSCRTNQPLRSVFGIGRELWAVGSGGTILHAVDGGKKWNEESSGTASSLKSVFGGSKELRAVGNNGTILRGVAAGRYPYIREARLRRDLLGARVEFRVVYPDVKPQTIRAALAGLNGYEFDQGREMQRNFVKEISAPQTGTDLWVFRPFSPQNDIFVRSGEPAHFRIELTTDDTTVGYDFAATYDPWFWFREHLVFLSIASPIALLMILFTFFLFTRPLWNLALYRWIKIYQIAEQIKLPGLGQVTQQFLKLTVLPWFVQHSRTLDAWIESHRASLPGGWEPRSQSQTPARDTASYDQSPGRKKARPSYIPLPVRLQSPVTGPLVQSPTAEWAGRLFNSRRTILEIVGPGGAGKTTLARQIAGWALAGGRPEGLRRHAMLPVWVDEELSDKNTMFDVVKRKLAGWFSEEELEPELIQALLRKQRILVIVDRLSERFPQSQRYVCTIHGSLKVNALLVTGRHDFDFEAAPAVVLYPQPLDPTSLLHFMTSLVRQHLKKTAPGDKDALTAFDEQLELGRRLAALIRVRGKKDQEVPILPLPVRIFVDEAVRLMYEGHSFDELPSSLPEVYFRYLEQINPKTPDLKNGMTDQAMLKAAKLLGRLAAESDFIPKEFSSEAARDHLRAAGWTDPEKLDPVQRLLDNGVITERRAGGFYRLRFELDPIAEFLAAAAWAEGCGTNTSSWTDVKKKSAGAPGFQIALRLMRQTYAPELDWDSI